VYVAESRVEISEKAAGYHSIVRHGVRAKGSGEVAEVSVKNLLQAEGAAAHGISEGD
jgi:hypothetical protein